ncbi:MAG: hypothetical protein FJ146_01140 [Deltaproteobacteria bacterium]|nr:hypothetical protein [Deltaproteobacteria bacterium]
MVAASVVLYLQVVETKILGVFDVLFGAANFSGRLSVTWPRDMSQVPVSAATDPLFP